ncbi:hypothetical protein [Streptomyces sp. NPDC020983]|uniref:putative phage holin n=1 Tax=Streptomyces sp. NPDC020983 TaxID=3365106 RepID=UPI00379BD248
MSWAEVANAAASGAVALAAAVFVVTYNVLAPWRASATGRHVMTFSAAVGALGAYTVAVTLWPDGTAATVLRVARVVVVLGLAGLLVQRTWMVIRAQRRR